MHQNERSDFNSDAAKGFIRHAWEQMESQLKEQEEEFDDDFLVALEVMFYAGAGTVVMLLQFMEKQSAPLPAVAAAMDVLGNELEDVLGPDWGDRWADGKK